MSEFIFKEQANTSLREKVTNDLREAILNGDLAPGARIKEMDIAEQMKVSRGPIREAIRQLEREGLLVSYPYKETVVADLGASEVQHILNPIRFHIEWYVVRTYLNLMDDDFFAKLQAIVDDMHASVAGGEKNRLVDLDLLFHHSILELATERTVMLTWQSIVNQIRLHFAKNLPFFDHDHMASDHQALLDAFRSKELERIQAAIVAHLGSDENLLCFSR
ncbi:GntR family transcriptional regulator [Paenibacillus sacheonensis]|uniref:GntR family transcriptional regulator n=1 Tax=Paenibacillus sacheonensis TaxID=742054 RepID=A0A7X5BWL0_9BACL|nr:GntR family transcriptional regulator [Paenibacillus sacheonensis]MBM7564030.1 DNA-binding GntR family transcriptional regulator [Paenibacillus sacheonensis]NBC67637.1 GntR family transcriptional regulator [Paenibacillus sacheonensis]